MVQYTFFQVTGFFLYPLKHTYLVLFNTAALAKCKTHCYKFYTSCSVVPRENTSLLHNLISMGVDIQKVRKRQPGVLRKQITNEKGVAKFLQNKGASKQTIANIISRYPRAVTRNFDHLEERWRLWRNIFNSDLDIVKVIDRSPESFFRSSDNKNLEENINFLSSLDFTSKDLLRLFTTAPRTFSNSCELNKQMVKFLQDVCFSLGGDRPDDFVKNIITRNIYVFIKSTKRVKANIEFVQTALNLTDEEMLVFLQGPGVDILALSNEYLKMNFKNAEHKLLSLGCSQLDVKNFIINYVSVLCTAPSNLTSKIDYLLQEGIHLEQIVAKPGVLGCSLETLKRRFGVLRSIKYNFNKYGISILYCSSKRFATKVEKLCFVAKE
ncbi:transcription termination factor 1, mitochondrial [Protopterus annectens]|uniref:transcription termination factor 1, mitochondrial n=1 Tax=Protopterus annectens TaxID=7888 RepID=UPI001CF9E550|nr:transcription termination factor 1, mitochondrial [Protopterus annectens]XP_043923599.1 transcription termination factor 1, mitochondrial [Protopterus annectens]